MTPELDSACRCFTLQESSSREATRELLKDDRLKWQNFSKKFSHNCSNIVQNSSSMNGSIFKLDAASKLLLQRTNLLT